MESSYTRDVDIAVYIDKPTDIVSDYGYVEEIASRLSLKTGLPIDIVVLNYASDPIFNRALLRGRPVVVRDKRLYIGLYLLAHEQKNRFQTPYSKPIQHQ